MEIIKQASASAEGKASGLRTKSGILGRGDPEVTRENEKELWVW